MDNNIYELQNTSRGLSLLRTQANIYSEAKKLVSLKLIFSVILACVFSVINYLFINDILYALSSFFSVASIFLMGIIKILISNKIKLAAKIQQVFDSYVFGYKLITDKFQLNKPITIAEERELIQKYDYKNYVGVVNWYNDYSTLSHARQVFFCQAENVRYDKRLRNKYKLFNIIIAGVSILLIILLSILVNLSVIKVLLIASWALPIIAYYFDLFYYLKKDNDFLVELDDEYKRIEQSLDSISEEALYIYTYEMQYYIYEKRINSILIPDWFYKLFKTKHQNIENDITKQIVSGI